MGIIQHKETETDEKIKPNGWISHKGEVKSKWISFKIFLWIIYMSCKLDLKGHDFLFYVLLHLFSLFVADFVDYVIAGW